MYKNLFCYLSTLHATCNIVIIMTFLQHEHVQIVPLKTVWMGQNMQRKFLMVFDSILYYVVY